MRIGTWTRLLLLAGLLGGPALGITLRADDPPAGKAGLRPALRRPVALAVADGGKWLCVANQRSGSISVIDTAARKVTAEVVAGRRLSDLTATPDGKVLLATDEEAGQLVLLRRAEAGLEVEGRVEVPPDPVAVAAVDGRYCLVASLWPRRLAVVALGSAPRVTRSVGLPLAPRRLLPVPGSAKVVVADAFGGRLAVVDTARGTVESVRTLPGHNLRGLALARGGQELLISHQTLNRLATTSRDDIHWGNLLTNNVRALSLPRVLGQGADLLRGSTLHQLGHVDRGAGDPAGLAVTADGTVAVALAGVGEVALGPGPRGDWRRVAVGRRPTAVVAAPDGPRVYVANTFADSVSVLDVQAAKVLTEISLGPQPPLGPSDRGELLFHDARLSHDGWFSCQSCHTDGHSNGLLNDNLSDGSYGTPKRVLSLLGTRDTGPWAWDGRMPDLEAQVRTSVKTTMQGKALPAEQVRDLTAYLRTLPAAPGVGRFDRAAPAAVRRGGQLFTEQGCAKCHVPPTFTSAKTYTVWPGGSAFNPPSLRGVSQGERFFHDNRAASLAEVFRRYRHQLQGELDARQLGDLLAYLNTL
jgi:YVTN family beta-propeller protein